MRAWPTLTPLAWCLAAATSAVQAQQTELSISPALGCLTPAATERGVPAYPAELLARRDGGTVEVELSFVDATSPPRVRWINGASAFRQLMDAVAGHVAGFRVPCLKEGDAPVSLRQDYVFVPNDGRKVMASQLLDDADRERRAQLKCLTRADGEREPRYPTESRREAEEGPVLVRLTFTRPDSPPAIDILASVPHRSLRRAVQAFASGWRLPCLGEKPVSATQVYKFKLDGGSRAVLRDLPLIDLLVAAKPLPSPVYFDLNTMGCPFDLRLTYYRPHQRNSVREVAQTQPARRAFLDWLAQAELKVASGLNTRLLGEQMTVHVPCATIDL